MLRITHQEAAEPSPAHAPILGRWLVASLLEANKLGRVRKQPFDLFLSRIEGNTGRLTWLVLAGFESCRISLSLILSTRNHPAALPNTAIILRLSQRMKIFSLRFRTSNKGHHVEHFATNLGTPLVVSLGFQFGVVGNFRIFVPNGHTQVAPHYQGAGVIRLRTSHDRTVTRAWIGCIAVSLRKANLWRRGVRSENAVSRVGR